MCMLAEGGIHRKGNIYIYMGGRQNFVPFLGTLYTRCRIILENLKGTIIFTTTHIYIYIYIPWTLNPKPSTLSPKL